MGVQHLVLFFYKAHDFGGNILYRRWDVKNLFQILNTSIPSPLLHLRHFPENIRLEFFRQFLFDSVNKSVLIEKPYDILLISKHLHLNSSAVRCSPVIPVQPNFFFPAGFFYAG